MQTRSQLVRDGATGDDPEVLRQQQALVLISELDPVRTLVRQIQLGGNPRAGKAGEERATTWEAA